MNSFTKAGYTCIFNEDKLRVYDANNTKINVTRSAVLKGWYVPGKGHWRIPVGKHIQRKDAVCNINTQTHLVSQLPLEILSKAPPPMKGYEQLNSAYELKKKTELIRYFHAAAGFPTKTT